MAEKSVKLKSGDKLDIQPVVEEAKRQEKIYSEEHRQWVKEVEELAATPDMPKRWGTHRKLTILTPGNIIADPTYIPEVVEDMQGRRRRVCKHVYINGQLRMFTPDGTEKLRWCLNIPQKLAIHKSHGFRFVSYKGTFADTGYFEASPQDWVVNGDLVLMRISVDGWERQIAQARRIKSALEGADAYGAELFDLGNRVGAPTFIEDPKRGVREFYT